MRKVFISQNVDHSGVDAAARVRADLHVRLKAHSNGTAKLGPKRLLAGAEIASERRHHVPARNLPVLVPGYLNTSLVERKHTTGLYLVDVLECRAGVESGPEGEGL